jgi:hypothetical protein
MMLMVMKRKKHHSMILLQMIVLFLLSCAGNGNGKPVNANSQNAERLSKEIEMWQSDSLGCQKLRTKQIAEKIIDSLRLESTAKADFLKVFGNSNIESKRGSNIILGYYFDAICRDGKFIDSADYCIAEFTFKTDKLVSRNYICR